MTRKKLFSCTLVILWEDTIKLPPWMVWAQIYMHTLQQHWHVSGASKERHNTHTPNICMFQIVSSSSYSKVTTRRDKQTDRETDRHTEQHRQTDDLKHYLCLCSDGKYHRQLLNVSRYIFLLKWNLNKVTISCCRRIDRTLSFVLTSGGWDYCRALLILSPLLVNDAN